MKLTSDELHAFVIGFFEVLCPWPANIAMHSNYPSPMKGEYHYYLAGRGFGFIALLSVLLILVKLAKEVLL